MLGDIRDRQVRAAENQSLFRGINEHVRDGSSDFSGVSSGWLCECANDRCFEHVELAPQEYDRVRAEGTTFIVAPDEAHVVTDVERIIDRHERYWVVEKIDAAAGVAEQLA